jgi:hypothetical protein
MQPVGTEGTTVVQKGKQDNTFKSEKWFVTTRYIIIQHFEIHYIQLIRLFFSFLTVFFD